MMPKIGNKLHIVATLKWWKSGKDIMNEHSNMYFAEMQLYEHCHRSNVFPTTGVFLLQTQAAG